MQTSVFYMLIYNGARLLKCIVSAMTIVCFKGINVPIRKKNDFILIKASTRKKRF